MSHFNSSGKILTPHIEYRTSIDAESKTFFDSLKFYGTIICISFLEALTFSAKDSKINDKLLTNEKYFSISYVCKLASYTDRRCVEKKRLRLISFGWRLHLHGFNHG